MTVRPSADNHPRSVLSLLNSVCIIVGIMIGVGIYESTPTIAGLVPNRTWLFGIWIVGGILSLAGALCYAELSSAYPREGGNYVYLTRAYGSWAGFLFAWAEMIIIRPGSVAAMAFPFARYLGKLSISLGLGTWIFQHQTIVAAMGVVTLMLINVWGSRPGAWTQTVLTMAKVAGLLAIVVVAFSFSPVSINEFPLPPNKAGDLGVALVLVLFCFGGWNEISYVAGEVKNPEKNLQRTLIVGVVGVSVVFLLVIAAFEWTLGIEAMASSDAVAADAMATVFPKWGPVFVSGLICISTLGAMAGLLFTDSRISYAVGLEHRSFRFLGVWNGHHNSPVRALYLLGGLSAVIVVLAGSFTNVIVYTTSVVWVFFFATGASVIALRGKEPNVYRPYRVTGYPYTVLIFCASCLYLVYSALNYNLKGSAVAVAILALGFPIYWAETQGKDPEGP